jgi:hypothetical protein
MNHYSGTSSTSSVIVRSCHPLCPQSTVCSFLLSMWFNAQHGRAIVLFAYNNSKLYLLNRRNVRPLCTVQTCTAACDDQCTNPLAALHRSRGCRFHTQCASQALETLSGLRLCPFAAQLSRTLGSFLLPHPAPLASRIGSAELVLQDCRRALHLTFLSVCGTAKLSEHLT